MPSPWIHGLWLIRGQVIELQERFDVQKGHPKKSRGWVARVCFAPCIEVHTTREFPTREEAENAIRAAFSAWLTNDDDQP